MSYDKFIQTKSIRAVNVGITDGPPLPDVLRPFQRDIVTWALRRGRAAIFAGTGLGKTLQQLSWARAVADHEDGAALIVTPLAVAQQTVAEAKKFGIPSVAYARDHSEIASSIVVTNYDRIEKFDLSKFVAVVLDESSIIKAHASKTRALLIDLCKNIPYRLCCTATPAPNDYIELGNHAEFLGVMTQKEMLATWFVHDGSMKATNVKNKGKKPTAEWRLKGHAEQEFWQWLSTWSVMLRHPRELGYDEPGYDLPPLHKHQITVPSDLPPALTLMERRRAKRDSIAERVRIAADLVNASPERPWTIWCDLNDESTMLAAAIHNAVEVRGADDPDDKAERLLGFASGKYSRLITKGSIAGFGLNFQICSDLVCVGLNDSFEKLYQLIRRHWRFGQTRAVNAYLIASAAEGAVVANLEAKEIAADRMANEMSKHTKNLMSQAVRGPRLLVPHNREMIIPAWMEKAA